MTDLYLRLVLAIVLLDVDCSMRDKLRMLLMVDLFSGKKRRQLEWILERLGMLSKKQRKRAVKNLP